MQTRYARSVIEIDNDPTPVNRLDKPTWSPRSAQTVDSTAGSHRNGASQNHENAMSDNRRLIEALTNSKLFQEYERAFNEAMGLPLALRPVETWQLPLHGKRNEGGFCALMSQTSRTCAACLQVQEHLANSATETPQTITCSHGLCETAVPVRLGNRLIGFLQTGQVFLKKPTLARFETSVRVLSNMGVLIDAEKLKKAYFATRVIPSKEHESVIKLLSIFAEHLSILSNQLVVQKDNSEPPAITRAKEYIQDHQGENMTLDEVAKAVHMSSFYFCKMFKKVAGINFTDYVSRLRIEKSKNLLLNPNLRVSEIAYEVGFQSLTHFNRVFKKVQGQSPSQYRKRLRRN